MILSRNTEKFAQPTGSQMPQPSNQLQQILWNILTKSTEDLELEYSSNSSDTYFTWTIHSFAAALQGFHHNYLCIKIRFIMHYPQLTEKIYLVFI